MRTQGAPPGQQGLPALGTAAPGSDEAETSVQLHCQLQAPTEPECPSVRVCVQVYMPMGYYVCGVCECEHVRARLYVRLYVCGV